MLQVNTPVSGLYLGEKKIEAEGLSSCTLALTPPLPFLHRGSYDQYFQMVFKVCDFKTHKVLTHFAVVAVEAIKNVCLSVLIFNISLQHPATFRMIF